LIVRILKTDADNKKVKRGDVVVAPMTIPSFMPALEKAIAFVTDEGGITCHASIVAREMHKPCIIGTKIATKVLKDGDMVEVDADRGVVTIIKNN
jgi:pyruvate,water dikinase